MMLAGQPRPRASEMDVLKDAVAYAQRSIEFLKTRMDIFEKQLLQHNMFCSECKYTFTVNDNAENNAYCCPRCCSPIVWVVDNQKV